MALYEVIVLGSPTKRQITELKGRVDEVASIFSLATPDDIVVRHGASTLKRNPKAATVALYFGGDPSVDIDKVDALEAAKVPVVPVVMDGARVSDMVPVAIQAVNACFVRADDEKLEALSAVAFEIIGLLHRQRRIFVSYRRSDSRDAAVQLHDELSSRGFDVFLDTHDIRPGAEFQEMLWHRLVDCDVMIMLDTKDYFGSKWTTQELGRSLALGVQILRLVWPQHSGSRHLSLSDTITLLDADFDTENRLSATRISEVANRAEALRSRSIATRQLEIVGKLKIEAERIGGKFEGIGAHRAIGITLPHGKRVVAYPVVGAPTAELLHDVHAKSIGAGHGRFPCLVYDHTGIRPAWLDHLTWLDENIAGVRALKVFGAGWELAKWDS
jgi:hypothetical protein